MIEAIFKMIYQIAFAGRTYPIKYKATYEFNADAKLSDGIINAIIGKCNIYNLSDICNVFNIKPDDFKIPYPLKYVSHYWFDYMIKNVKDPYLKPFLDNIKKMEFTEE